jgi:hypothetical protein
VCGRVIVGLLALASLASGGGCVKRRMTIRSNPPGARVLIDDQEIGVTPVSSSFTYYATRKIQLIKDGFEPLTVLSPFPAPWYEIPPFDLVSENFAGREIRDERAVEFQLVPQQLVPEEVLLGRAEALRGQARQGYAVPLLRPAAGPVLPAAQPPMMGPGLSPSPSGPAPFAPAPSGSAPFAPAPSGPAPSGPAPSGPAPFAPAPSGPAPFAPAPSGPAPFDPSPSAPAPFAPTSFDTSSPSPLSPLSSSSSSSLPR